MKNRKSVVKRTGRSEYIMMADWKRWFGPDWGVLRTASTKDVWICLLGNISDPYITYHEKSSRY